MTGVFFSDETWGYFITIFDHEENEYLLKMKKQQKVKSSTLAPINENQEVKYASSSPLTLSKKISVRDLSSMEFSKISETNIKQDMYLKPRQMETDIDSLGDHVPFNNRETYLKNMHERHTRWVYAIIIGCILYGATFFL